MNLSPHFTLVEMTVSSKGTRLGLDNTPTPQAMDKLYDTAAGLERVRDVLCTPIVVISGYRSPKVNAAVGGAMHSQHMNGEAADFISPSFGTPLDICREILNHADYVDFDQLIWEGAGHGGGAWVHISFSDTPRRSVMTATFQNGKAVYSKGLPKS